MEEEADRLRRLIARYRDLMKGVSDPRLEKALTDLIAEAEARFAALHAASKSPPRDD